MHNYKNTVCHREKRLAMESDIYIRMLYTVPCLYARNMLLYQLKAKLDEMHYLNEMLCNSIIQGKNSPTGSLQQNEQNQRDLTLQELTKFNGKDGNPAYVAVNGVIYDVTNNAAWAAATHFGLTAGNDLTKEFASCHAGQTILSKLSIVGKLIQ